MQSSPCQSEKRELIIVHIWFLGPRCSSKMDRSHHRLHVLTGAKSFLW